MNIVVVCCYFPSCKLSLLVTHEASIFGQVRIIAEQHKGYLSNILTGKLFLIRKYQVLQITVDENSQLSFRNSTYFGCSGLTFLE